MVELKIYVVFHKNIFRECYADIPDDVFRKYMSCFAVNKEIKKEYDPWFDSSIVREYELPTYFPVLQQQRFCESSAYIHMFVNWDRLVEPYEFVGCVHYDMTIKAATLEYMIYTLKTVTNPSNTVFYFDKVAAKDNLGSSFIVNDVEECLSHHGWRIILDRYNEFFGTEHEYDSVVFDDMILNHTFVIHKSLLARICPFFVSVLPRIQEFLHHRVRHLPYMLESLWGFLLLLNKRENPMTRWIKMDIIHDESLKDRDFGLARNTG
jgi:hypothetical protein